MEIISRETMIEDNVKRLRKENVLMQGAPLREVVIPYATLTKLESDVLKKPSVQIVAKIAKALDVSMEELNKLPHSKLTG